MGRAGWLVVVLMVLLMGPTLGSCGSDTASTTTGDPAAGPTSSTTVFDPFAMKWGETVTGENSGVAVTVGAPVDDTENLSAFDKSAIGDGNRLWYCLVTYTNNGTASFPFNEFAFTFYDSADMKAEDFVTATPSQPVLDSGDVLPGRTVSGVVAVIIPAERTIAHVDFQPTIESGTVASWGD